MYIHCKVVCMYLNCSNFRHFVALCPVASGQSVVRVLSNCLCTRKTAVQIASTLHYMYVFN